MNQFDDRGIPLDWQAPKCGVYLAEREAKSDNGKIFSGYSYLLESSVSLSLLEQIMGCVRWFTFPPTTRPKDLKWPVLMTFTRNDSGMSCHVENVVFHTGTGIEDMLKKVKAHHGNHQDH